MRRWTRNGEGSNKKELRRSHRVATVLQVAAELDVPQMCLLLYRISLSKFANCSKQSTSVGGPYLPFPCRRLRIAYAHWFCGMLQVVMVPTKHSVQLGLHVLQTDKLMERLWTASEALTSNRGQLLVCFLGVCVEFVVDLSWVCRCWITRETTRKGSLWPRRWWCG